MQQEIQSYTKNNNNNKTVWDIQNTFANSHDMKYAITKEYIPNLLLDFFCMANLKKVHIIFYEHVPEKTVHTILFSILTHVGHNLNCSLYKDLVLEKAYAKYTFYLQIKYILFSEMYPTS